MLTSAGSGYSRWGDLALTRWREDADLRRLRLLPLHQGRAQRRGVVGGLPAERRRAGRLRRGLQRGSRRGDAPRRLADDDAGRARFRRGRRRSSPRLDHEFRRRRPRHRNHLLRRTRSGAAERRHRASRLLEAVRRDGISRRHRRDSGDAAQASADRAGNLGRASERRRRRSHRRRRIRNRPGAFPRPRPQHSHAHRRDRQPSAVELGRRRPRPDLLDPPPRPRRAGRDRSRGVLDHRRLQPRRAARRRRQASRRRRVCARLDAGVDAGAGAAPPSRRDGRRGRAVSAACRACDLCRAGLAPVLGYDRAGRRRAVGPVAAGDFRRSADRARCASPTSSISTSSANCCRRTNIGG